MSISGAAGTGKTATLQELRRGIMDAGRKVFAVAPTMSAVEELQKVGFADAITVERLLQDPRVRDGVRGKCHHPRRGWHGLGASDGRSAQVRRRMFISGGLQRRHQTNPKCGGRRCSSNTGKGIAAQDRRADSGAAANQKGLSRARWKNFAGTRSEDSPSWMRWAPFVRSRSPIELRQSPTHMPAAVGQTLVVCATHDEIDRVTEAIRERRKTCGQLGEGRNVSRHMSLNWTTAQKADLQNYRPGQLLGFHRAVRSIAKYETAEVVSLASNGIVVRKEDGTERMISTKQVGSFDVLEARPIEVSAGDRLLLTANRREAGLRITNGELVTVSDVDSAGRIQLEDGRTLPSNYRSFAHGYAVTAHRSQGKTVDSVILSGDGMQKELFYVAASRGRQSVTVITSDKERLQETVARSMARTSASELVRDKLTLSHQGAHRGMAMAREMVRRAAALVTSVSKQILQQEIVRSRPRKERTRERGLGR